MTASPLLLLPLDGSLAYEDGGAGGTATGVGALRWVDGPSSGMQAALIEPATTNHHQDPYAPGALWAWTPISDGTIARDPANLPPLTGLPANAASVKYTKTAAGTINGGQHWDRRISGALGGTQVSVSGWVYHNRPGPETLNIQIQVAGAAWFGQPVVVPPSAWTYVSASATLGVGATECAGRVETPSWSNGDALWIFGLQVEQQAAATTLTPKYDGSGVIRPGYAWTGTVHDSDSTRSATEVLFPRSAFNLVDGESFTIAGRVRFPRIVDGMKVFEVGSGSSNWVDMPWVFIGGGGTQLAFNLTGGDSGGWKLITMNGLSGSTWYTFVWSYDGSTRQANLWVNGDLIGSTSLSGGFTWPVDATTGNAGLTGSGEWSSIFTFEEALTEPQAKVLSSASEWTFDMSLTPRAAGFDAGWITPVW